MSQIIDRFANEQQLEQINRELIDQSLWRFGQKSNNLTLYPMWFINLYNLYEEQYKDICVSAVKELVDKLLCLYPGKKIFRVMLAGNTYGLDGDIHIDNENIDHITCVVYLNQHWEQNWGGETLIFEQEQIKTILPKPGTAVIFNSKYPHVGKAPNRNCGKLRTILAIQICDK